MYNTISTIVNTPSPTNPSETLEQSETRVAHEIETEVAETLEVTDATAKEATELWAADPAVADKFNAAQEKGLEESPVGQLATAINGDNDSDDDSF